MNQSLADYINLEGTLKDVYLRESKADAKPYATVLTSEWSPRHPTPSPPKKKHTKKNIQHIYLPHALFIEYAPTPRKFNRGK